MALKTAKIQKNIFNAFAFIPRGGGTHCTSSSEISLFLEIADTQHVPFSYINAAVLRKKCSIISPPVEKFATEKCAPAPSWAPSSYCLHLDKTHSFMALSGRLWDGMSVHTGQTMQDPYLHKSPFGGPKMLLNDGTEDLRGVCSRQSMHVCLINK